MVYETLIFAGILQLSSIHFKLSLGTLRLQNLLRGQSALTDLCSLLFTNFQCVQQDWNYNDFGAKRKLQITTQNGQPLWKLDSCWILLLKIQAQNGNRGKLKYAGTWGETQSGDIQLQYIVTNKLISYFGSQERQFERKKIYSKVEHQNNKKKWILIKLQLCLIP